MSVLFLWIQLHSIQSISIPFHRLAYSRKVPFSYSMSHSHCFFSKISIIQFSLWPLSDGAAVCRDLVALVLCCCQSSVQLQHPFRVCLKAYQLGNPILRPDQSRQQLHKAPKFFFPHLLFCVLWCPPHRYCTGQQEWWNSKLPAQHTKQLSAIVSVLNEYSCQALTFGYLFLIMFFFYHF